VGPPNSVRRVVIAIAALAVIGSLASCARPDFQYASEQPGTAPAGKVYFKVPSGWTQLSAAAITKAESAWTTDSTAKNLLQATAWQSAFDAAPAPSLEHVLGIDTPEQPTVYASLRQLYAEEKTSINDAALRDMVVPVSTLGSSVEILSDAKVSQGSAHGVHLVFSYDPGSGRASQVVDQTTLVSGGDDAVYLLLVRCSTDCYAKYRAEITSVTSSYTIQEGRNG